MSYFLDGENVFETDDGVTGLVGTLNKTETVRIDNETVEDVAYTFNLEWGYYVEQSRTRRAETYVPPVSEQTRIEELEATVTAMAQILNEKGLTP